MTSVNERNQDSKGSDLYFSLDETQLYEPDNNYWMDRFFEGDLPLIINNTWALIIIITQTLL